MLDGVTPVPMATVDDVRAIAMSLPRTSEHLIRDPRHAWCMCVPKKVQAAYLEGRGL